MISDSVSTFTLDQFVVFVTVVDRNGFAAAARHLGRAQSAITYAIKGLEKETGTPLFDRSAYRPVLTEAGQTLLPRARRLVADLADYCRQAQSFTAGVEARLSVVSDIFAPVPLVAKALAEVHHEFPSVNVRFVVGAPPAAIESLRNGQAQVGVLSAQAPFGVELHTAQWTTHDLVAVAAPSHPLTAMRSIAPADLHGHMQIVWTAADAPPNSPEAGGSCTGQVVRHGLGDETHVAARRGGLGQLAGPLGDQGPGGWDPGTSGRAELGWQRPHAPLLDRCCMAPRLFPWPGRAPADQYAPRVVCSHVGRRSAT